MSLSHVRILVYTLYLLSLAGLYNTRMHMMGQHIRIWGKTGACSAPYAYIGPYRGVWDVPYAYAWDHPVRVLSVWANIMSHTRMGVPYEYMHA